MRPGIKWLLFITILFLGVMHWVQFLDEAPSSASVQKTVEIPKGASYHTVIDLLDRKGLLTRPFYFNILGKVTGGETRIQPGEYQLHTAMRPMEILKVLVDGKVVLHRVVIPEGLTSREIAAILEKSGLVNSHAFLEATHDTNVLKKLGIEAESLEGYLFPETYKFVKETPPIEVIQIMVRQLQAVYDTSFQNRADEIGMTQLEVLTLASIIEKETAVGSERGLISGVFHNRLKKKMRLQSDPTVIFSLSDFDGNLTRKHLRNASPYNTYKVKGLPPGPIASPGRDSIYAALYPEDVDYLYFVSKNNGTHHFSKTIREHNNAVRKYQLRRKSEVLCRLCTQKVG
ncbi:MAG: endolytic transglycosylase MltG [Nitrospira sp.]|nr:endolytic transglycosylase MltG [Candidatus Manganitrophaceae bacterium]